jgi:hypothetical protein
MPEALLLKCVTIVSEPLSGLGDLRKFLRWNISKNVMVRKCGDAELYVSFRPRVNSVSYLKQSFNAGIPKRSLGKRRRHGREFR